MHGQGHQQTGTPQTNAWNRQAHIRASPPGSSPTTCSSQQPGNHSGTQHSLLSSSSTDASTSTPATTTPLAAPNTQRPNAGSHDTNTTPPALCTNSNPGAHWFGVYEDDSNEDEEDDHPDMDTANTPAQDRTGDTPPLDPEPTAVPQVSTEALLQAAIEEARRKSASHSRHYSSI